LADFQEHKPEFDKLGASVVALSSDSPDGARQAVEKLGLGFTVLGGLDASLTSNAIGCYTGVHDGSPHVQPASFVLDPEGKVRHAVYSSGKVGRLTAEDALSIVRDLQKTRGAPDAGSSHA
jgi:peroxiredoxin